MIALGYADAQPSKSMAISSRELANICNDFANTESKNYCDIYGQGVYDAYLVTRHPSGASEFICVMQPAPVRREVMAQYMDWLSLNHHYDHVPAADSFLRFLSVRFPCDAAANVPSSPANKIIR